MGRLPAALSVALAASLGLHAAALCFLPDLDPLAGPEEAPPLRAELRPAARESPPPPPPPPPPPSLPPPALSPPSPPSSTPRVVPQAAKTPDGARRPSRKPDKLPAPIAAPAPAPAVSGAGPAVPDTLPATENASATPPAGALEAAPAQPAVPSDRLPPNGRILFRVDWGDSGFVIGSARQEWTIEDGRYRLVSTVETTGLAALFRSVDIDMESVGRISGDGLQPEVFGVRRSGKKARERALFDWETLRLRVNEANDYALAPGAQDLLSFYYQLGFLDVAPQRTVSLPLATGKKYSVYPLENLGDEAVELPLGTLVTRHLRSPGERLTDIWLAYEYRLLPVKIRHVDDKGKVFVQVATEIRFGE
jgi:hypothetical protein